ncbi:MAG: CHAT domain-containing protein [Gammaproteobacteria bacterium]|nr:CHAT domain-containing protein [Gammaproteobacteria bacterium]
MSNGSEKPVKEHEQKKTILLLSANPKDTKRLRLDEEAREMQKSLDRAKHRDNFKIEQRWAVTTTDIRRSLLDVKPKIVHFSGHGEGRMNDGNFRSIDIEERMEGLIFEDEAGNHQLVPSNVLADLFSLFSNQIECIVLNSCYSETQATELIKFIPYVIGMKKEIGDAAAISFSVAFYDALLAGNSIEFAFKVGCNGIQLEGIPEHLTPVLKVRDPKNKTNDHTSPLTS